MTTIELLTNQVSELNSTEFLTLIEEECNRRKVDRDKVTGGNDVEINKIHMLLTDQFWMRKIYVILVNNEYKGFRYNRDEAQVIADFHININHRDTYYGRTFNAWVEEATVDLRDVY